MKKLEMLVRTTIDLREITTPMRSLKRFSHAKRKNLHALIFLALLCVIYSITTATATDTIGKKSEDLQSTLVSELLNRLVMTPHFLTLKTPLNLT